MLPFFLYLVPDLHYNPLQDKNDDDLSYGYDTTGKGVSNPVTDAEVHNVSSNKPTSYCFITAFPSVSLFIFR